VPSTYRLFLFSIHRLAYNIRTDLTLFADVLMFGRNYGLMQVTYELVCRALAHSSPSVGLYMARYTTCGIIAIICVLSGVF